MVSPQYSQWNTRSERRAVGRQISRFIPESRGHRASKAKIAQLDPRCVRLRLESHHQLTRRLLDTYSENVIEDLDLVAMKHSMARWAFRRSVSNAALDLVRAMATYRAEHSESKATIADRWFPSSELHHGCHCKLIAEHKLDKMLKCGVTSKLVDRGT
ncbi:MAG: transposase [Acidimicrobiales bacterium]